MHKLLLNRRLFNSLLVILSLSFAVSWSIRLGEHELAYYFLASSKDLSIYYPNFYWLIPYIAVFLLYLTIPISLLLIIVRSIISEGLKNTAQNIMILSGSTGLSLILCELILMLVGYQPGQHSINKWVDVKDEVQILPGMTVDENGIYRFDTSVAEQLWDELIEKSNRS